MSEWGHADVIGQVCVCLPSQTDLPDSLERQPGAHNDIIWMHEPCVGGLISLSWWLYQGGCTVDDRGGGRREEEWVGFDCIMWPVQAWISSNGQHVQKAYSPNGLLCPAWRKGLSSVFGWWKIVPFFQLAEEIALLLIIVVGLRCKPPQGQ